MNESKNNQSVEQQPLMYPNYINPTYADDEINLVDVWIALRAYKKQFFISLLLLCVIGGGLLFLTSKPKYNLVSVIQIGTIDSNSTVPIETASNAKGKIENIYIPQVLRDLNIEKDQLSLFDTSITHEKEGDSLVITNKIIQSDIDVFTRFQNSIVNYIVEDHNKRIALNQSSLFKQLRLEELALQQLKSPITLSVLLAGGIKQSHVNTAAIKKGIEDAIAIQSLIVKEVKLLIESANRTHIVSQPSVSLKEVGLNLKIKTILLIFASGFIAFIIVLLAMFKDKVNLRLLETKGDI